MAEQSHAQAPSPPPLAPERQAEGLASPAVRPVGESLRSAKRVSAATGAQQPSSRAETAVPTPRNVIPDGCNMGTLLRVAVGTNVAAFVLSFSIARAEVLSAFLSAAAVLEP